MGIMLVVMNNTAPENADTLTLADLRKTHDTLRAMMPNTTPDEHLILWHAMVMVRQQILNQIAKG
jgi:hypothetical protein